MCVSSGPIAQSDRSDRALREEAGLRFAFQKAKTNQDQHEQVIMLAKYIYNDTLRGESQWMGGKVQGA